MCAPRARLPVVGAVTHLQVVQPVHLGAHLLGGGELLDNPVDAVAPQARWARIGPPLVDLVVIGRQVLPERTARKSRDVLAQHVRQVTDPSRADEADRFDDLRRRDLIERASLILSAVFRRPPWGPVHPHCALRVLHHAGTVLPARGTFQHGYAGLLARPGPYFSPGPTA